MRIWGGEAGEGMNLICAMAHGAWAYTEKMRCGAHEAILYFLKCILWGTCQGRIEVA